MAVSPALSDETSDVRAMVGGVVSATVVSIVRVSELLESAPSSLVLPAESVNAPEATEITPSEVLSVSGVKFAV